MAQSKKAAAQPETLLNTPVWPEGYYDVRDDGTIEGVVNKMLVAGHPKTGKSTLAIDFAAAMPGEAPRVTVLDIDGGWRSLKKHYSVNYFPIKDNVVKKYGMDWREEHLYLEYYRVLTEELPKLKQDIIVIDTMDKLIAGFHEHICNNAKKFGANGDTQFRGKGSSYAYGPLKREFRKQVEWMGSQCQTVILLSHMGGEYDGDGKKTGYQIGVKDRFDDIMDLTLILGRDPKITDETKQNPLFARVKHQRLTKKIWIKDGVRLAFPETIPALPSAFRLEHPKQSYVERLHNLLETPEYVQPATDTEDPEELHLSEEEKAAQQLALAQATAEVMEKRARTKFFEDMKAEFGELFPSGTDIVAVLNDAGYETYTVQNDEKMRLAVKTAFEAAQGQTANG